MPDQNKQTVIIDVSLNSADARAKAESLTKSIADLKNQQAELKKSGDTLSATYVSNAQQLKALQAEQKGYVTLSQTQEGSITALKAQLVLLTAQWNGLSKAERENSEAGKALGAQIKAINEKLNDNAKVTGAWRAGLENASSAAGLFGGALEQSANLISTSYSTLQNTITSLSGILEKLTAAQEANAAASILKTEAEQLEIKATELSAVATKAKTIADEASTKAKEAYNVAIAAGLTEEEALTAAKVASTEATELSTAATKAQEEAIIATEAATKAQTIATEAQTAATTLGSQAMNLFKIALASTGIGLLVIALGSLIAYFQSTNEGAKKFQQITNAIGAVLQGVLKVLAPIGKAIFDVFTEPQGAVKLMTSLFGLSILPIKTLASILWDLAHGNFKQAFKDIGDGVVEFAQKTREAGEAAVHMFKDTVKASGEAADAINKIDFSKTVKNSLDATKARQALNKEERLWSEEKKKQQGEVDLLTKKLRDQSLTESQRIDLAEKAKKIKEGVFQNDLKYAKLNEQLVEREQALNSKKDYQAITDAKNRVQEVINQKDLEVQGIINRESKLSQADKKKKEDAEKSNDDITAIQAKALKAQDELRESQEKETLESIKDENEKEQAIIKADYNKKIDEAKRQKYTMRNIQLEEDANSKAAMIKANHDIDKLTAQFEKEREAKLKATQDKQRANAIKREDEHRKQMAKDAEDELKRKEAQAKKNLEIEQNLANALAELQHAKNEAAIAATDLAIQLFGKNSEIGKAAFVIQKGIAIGEIIINTQKQVSDIEAATAAKLKADAALGWFGIGATIADTAIGAAQVTTAEINGAIRAATVAATAISGFARGGMYTSDDTGGYIQGPGTGTSDSINAKLSNGEFVVNATSTKMYPELLSAINTAGGGRPLIGGSSQTHFASGGVYLGGITQQVTGQVSQLSPQLSPEAIAAAIALQFKNLPPPVVGVKEIISGINNVTQLKQNGTF